MQLIDTHVHLNFDSFSGDLEAVRERWRQAGVSRLVHSCVEPSEFDAMRAIADRCPELSLAVGLHPLSAERWTPELGDEIERLAGSDDRVVAIGETGLDFFKADDRERQTAAFERHLQIATRLDRPVIIHCRDAADEMVRVLRDWRDRVGPLPRCVMHCWAGTPDEVKAFVDFGFYVSFSGIVTFKTAQAVRDSVVLVPDDRLLVETDCPFLAPVPHRGKRNEPAFVRAVAERVAELRGIDLETLARQTTENAQHCFKLPPSRALAA
ncbi:MAG: TatD family hydrolase [Geitlerinemataceae cyanobacterium]